MILNRQLIRNNKIPTCELINITANEITGKNGHRNNIFNILQDMIRLEMLDKQFYQSKLNDMLRFF